MRVLGILVLLFYSFRLAFNYNMQLQAKVVVKKDFFKNYLRNSKPASVHFDIEVPPGLAAVLGYEMERKALRSDVPNEQESWDRDLKAVPKLVEHLIQQSDERFHTTITSYSVKLKKINKHSSRLNSTINTTSHRYQSKLRQFVGKVLKYDLDNQVDKDVVFLDIIQTSNRFIYEETLKCLQSLIDNDSVKSKKDPVQNLAEDIFRNNLIKKKEDFYFICKMMKICRPFPGFSDYLADFFGELSKLPENRLHTIIMKTIVIVKKKYSDVEHILGEHLVKKLDKQLQNIIYDDLEQTRKALSVKRREIFERYKSKKISDGTKAFRLLLDMADKAFDMEGAAEVAKHFNTITKALREWVAGQEINIEVIEHSFLDYVADTLSARWINNTNKEVRSLVQIILEGKPSKERYDYLLINGSNFVNNI